MKKKIFIAAALLMRGLQLCAQGIVVNKTDGTKVYYPAEEVESVAAYGYGEELVSSFTACPDTNHPHIIDLGLPSGTKWACCNVGATAPEQYGDYFAWGETKTKSVFNWATYQYGTSSDNVYNIGSDITGTQYDTATTNWDAPWCMPSLTQIQELLNNTTSEWTTQNRVNGLKFTGQNGGTIFLPAAGFASDKVVTNPNLQGEYWSSTLGESSPSYAYGLSISRYSTYDSGRCVGRSIRPVRKN